MRPGLFLNIKSASSPQDACATCYVINSRLGVTHNHRPHRPLGYSSQQQYSAIDQPTQSTNALAQNASLTYDAAGRVTAVINPAGITIESYT